MAICGTFTWTVDEPAAVLASFEQTTGAFTLTWALPERVRAALRGPSMVSGLFFSP